jgi:hypothetical protein
MVNTVSKTELEELREEAYQDALQKAFEAEYEKHYAAFRDEGYSEEAADLCAKDEARACARDYYEDYFVEPDQ